jgi:hypothetical protein
MRQDAFGTARWVALSLAFLIAAACASPWLGGIRLSAHHDKVAQRLRTIAANVSYAYELQRVMADETDPLRREELERELNRLEVPEGMPR